MALMEKMRGWTKVVLYLLVFAFVGTIIFDWGMDVTGLKSNPKVVGEVNGREIDIDFFWRAYQAELNSYTQRTGSSPSDAQQEYISNQIWEQILQETLINQELQERGITVSGKEIFHSLVNNPPQFLRSDSNLQTNGQFDRQKYDAALRDRNNNWKPVEDFLRQQIPRQKLQDQLTQGIFISESEVRAEYLKRNQKATVEYLSISPDKFKDAEIEISDSEITQYYNEHKDEYKEPLKRKIEYVMYSISVTGKDTAAIKDLALDLFTRAKSGEDFVELAQTYSDDGSAENGGDLGFFKRGDMVKPFEDAAYNASIGDIVGPVESRFGLHIIKVVDKKGRGDEQEVKASHILLKYEASQETVNAARDSATFFASLAKEDGWKAAIEEEKVQTQTSTFFTEGTSFVPGIGISRPISRFVFKNNIGDISDSYEIPQRGFVVVRIVDEQDARTKTKEEVRGIIENALKTEKQLEMAGKYAANLKTELQSGASFEAASLNNEVEHEKSEPFLRSGTVQKVGADPSFIGAAFALSPGDVSEPVKGNRAYYIIKLLEKTAFDSSDFAEKKKAIKNNLISQKQNQIFNKWYATLKEDAKIVDNRKEFF